jgi:hypothetical protein
MTPSSVPLPAGLEKVALQSVLMQLVAPSSHHSRSDARCIAAAPATDFQAPIIGVDAWLLICSIFTRWGLQYTQHNADQG